MAEYVYWLYIFELFENIEISWERIFASLNNDFISIYNFYLFRKIKVCWNLLYAFYHTHLFYFLVFLFSFYYCFIDWFVFSINYLIFWIITFPNFILFIFTTHLIILIISCWQYWTSFVWKSSILTIHRILR